MPSRQKSNDKNNPGNKCKPGKVLAYQDVHAKKQRQVKPRRLRCDCGQIAITLLTVKVGSDPQYTIHLPLCRDCLALEQSLHTDRY
jgi:hypothetical protein